MGAFFTSGSGTIGTVIAASQSLVWRNETPRASASARISSVDSGARPASFPCFVRTVPMDREGISMRADSIDCRVASTDSIADSAETPFFEAA
ncbi:MAG: hypothetical protein U0414_06230 [Polyangiaceae bacterium]